MADRKQKLEEKRAADVEALKRNLKWRIQEMHMERDKKEAARLKAIKTEQEGFVVEVDELLQNKAEQDVMKCKEVHQVWEKEVYNRLCHQMDQYVEACESKPNGLFRDIIIESE